MELVPDPDGAGELLALNVYLINVEEHLLKAHGLKHVLSLRTPESDTRAARSVSLSLVDRSYKSDTPSLCC